MYHAPRGVATYGVGTSADVRGTGASRHTGDHADASRTAAITDGELRDRYRDLLDRLEEVEPQVRAYLPEPGRRDRVLAELDALIARYPDAASRPPLFGVPLGVKDIFRAHGFETRAGSKLPPEIFEGPEAPSVTRFRDAGAIVVGKTVTTEFAYFQPGPTANPWNPSHTPGGSSSGSAAAVSSGTAAIALGTQTIGSVNRPASFCGVVGFKPSFGRVPTDGVIPFSASADHVGVLAADLESAAAAARVLWDSWQDEPATRSDATVGTVAEALAAAGPARPPVSGREPLTFVLPDDVYSHQADREMRGAVDAVAAALAAAGHRIERIAYCDEIEDLNNVHTRLVAREFADVHRDWVARYGELYSERSRALIDVGKDVDETELYAAREGRLSERERANALLESHGAVALLTPSAPSAAPEGLGATGSPILNLPWTYAGLPTITVPATVNPAGLPLGIQLVGRFGRDEELLAVAYVVESVCRAAADARS